MLDHPEPVPTGLITALLARSNVKTGDMGERIGPSPRQMRELMEGRGLFSPYKLHRVAELTGVPEERIRAVQGLISDLSSSVPLPVGTEVKHPHLGPVEIVTAGREVTIRTRAGRVIEGVHPVSFASAEILDQFGLAPDVGKTAVGQLTPPLVTKDDKAKPLRAASPEPAITLTTPLSDETSEDTTHIMKTTLPPKETPIPEADTQPASVDDEKNEESENIPASTSPTPVAIADMLTPLSEEVAPDEASKRELINRLIERSGQSRAAISRAIGKDPSFLSGILTRGRRMPSELLPPLARACGVDPLDAESEGLIVATENGEVADSTLPDMSGPDIIAQGADLMVEARQASDADEAVDPEMGILPTVDAPSVVHGGQSAGSATIEVIIEGVCRVYIPDGFDMDAAARLIRSVVQTRNPEREPVVA